MFNAPATLMPPFAKASVTVQKGRFNTPTRPSAGFERLISGPGGLIADAPDGGLAGLFFRRASPRRLRSYVLRLGGVAVISSIAFSAWQNWNAGAEKEAATDRTGHSPDAIAVPSQPASPPLLLGTNFLPASETAQQTLARTLVRALISAAKAGGAFSPSEQLNTFKALKAMQLPRQHADFLIGELTAPANMRALVDAASSPEVAATIYMASALVIQGTTLAEKDYLGLLAARLRLAPDLVAHLHASAEAATAV